MKHIRYITEKVLNECPIIPANTFMMWVVGIRFPSVLSVCGRYAVGIKHPDRKALIIVTANVNITAASLDEAIL